MSLERCIIRTYTLPVREVREAILAYITAKGIAAPKYVGDTDDTKWTNLPSGAVEVQWTEKDEV